LKWFQVIREFKNLLEVLERFKNVQLVINKMRGNLISLFIVTSLLFLTPSIFAYSVIEKTNPEGELYSVIGENRGCSVYADETFEISFEENVLIDDIFIDVCGNKNAFANTFDSEWNPYMEYKEGSFVCGFEDGCLLEVYCCSYSECVNDNVCKDNEGMFSKCKKIQCEEWKNEGYKCDVEGLEEKIPYQYSEISYCTKSSNNMIYIFIGVLVIIALVVIYLIRKKK
jgi:hypothetical protein